MMLTPPRDADEAFLRLTPDLQEIAEYIDSSRLDARERRRLASLLAEYFASLARTQARPELRLVVSDASRNPQVGSGRRA